MGDKRVLNAFCGAADITLCGLPHAEGAKYVPPTAEVTVFALEKGFATTEHLGAKSNAELGGQTHAPQPFIENDSWTTNNRQWSEQ